MKQVKQIISADGWRAVYREDDGDFYVEPLCCWAVVEEGGDSFVVGMDAAEMVAACDSASNFVGYLASGESTEKYGGTE